MEGGRSGTSGGGGGDLIGCWKETKSREDDDRAGGCSG